MTRTRMWLALVLLVVAAGSWLVFSMPKASSGANSAEGESAVPPAEPEAAPAPASSTPALGAAPAASAAASAPAVPLEKLLELPDSAQPKPEVTVGPLPRSKPSAEPVEQSRGRVQVDAATARDRPIVRPDEAAERLDVGVSVEMDETTRVRGGVRVESRAEERREPSRTPTLGVEKRF